MQKTSQQKFRKFNSWIDKKDVEWNSVKYNSIVFGGDINFKVDLSNYAAKSDLKNATGIDISKLAVKSDLISLKAGVNKSNIDKLKSVPTNLRNLKGKVDK